MQSTHFARHGPASQLILKRHLALSAFKKEEPMDSRQARENPRAIPDRRQRCGDAKMAERLKRPARSRARRLGSAAVARLNISAQSSRKSQCAGLERSITGNSPAPHRHLCALAIGCWRRRRHLRTDSRRIELVQRPKENIPRPSAQHGRQGGCRVCHDFVSRLYDQAKILRGTIPRH